MTDKPDTSSEAVERLVALHSFAASVGRAMPMQPSMAEALKVTASTLRALLAERDAALAQVAASEAKLVTMIEAREARTSAALPPAPSGMAAGTHMGWSPLSLRAIEQRVAALEQRMRNR